MYCVIIEVGKNNIEFKRVIGFSDIGNISIAKAKLIVTNQLKQYDYQSFINYGNGKGTRFPWCRSGITSIWVLRNKLNRLYQHKVSGKKIRAYLIPKLYSELKDEVGLPDLAAISTGDLIIK